jgi:hypothetical protein
VTRAAEDSHIWGVSAGGTLINRAAGTRMDPEYEACARFVCDRLHQTLGEDAASIYVRGSVAVGEAVPPFSDLDLVVLTKAPPSGEMDALRALTLERFRFLQDVDIALCPKADLGATSFGKVVLSYLLVEAKRLSGEDSVAGFAPLRPDAEFARMRFPGLAEQMTWLLALLEGRVPTGHYRGVARPADFWAKWSMRALLRSTQMLAMLDTRLYSNHLPTCRALASARFAADSDWIDRIATNERRTRSDPDEAAALLRWWRERMLPLWASRVDPATDV